MEGSGSVLGLSLFGFFFNTLQHCAQHHVQQMAWRYVNKEIWLAKSFLLRHTVACNVAGGRHSAIVAWNVAEVDSLLLLPHDVQYCTQQLERWTHGAIHQLHELLLAMLHRVSRPEASSTSATFHATTLHAMVWCKNLLANQIFLFTWLGSHAIYVARNVAVSVQSFSPVVKSSSLVLAAGPSSFGFNCLLPTRRCVMNLTHCWSVKCSSPAPPETLTRPTKCCHIFGSWDMRLKTSSLTFSACVRITKWPSTSSSSSSRYARFLGL